MAQACLKCLKFTMCAANFLCFISGISLLGLGIYMTVTMKMAITPSLASLNAAQILMITGIIITCVSFLGFLGALKENRCLLLTFFLLLFLLMLAELAAACLILLYDQEISQLLEKDLKKGLEMAKKPNNATSSTDWDWVQEHLHCCGFSNASDWGNNIPKSCIDPDTSTYFTQGCFTVMRDFFEKNFLYIGIAVILFCIIEVLAMCFAMTLFCHISRTGLGYKL